MDIKKNLTLNQMFLGITKPLNKEEQCFIAKILIENLKRKKDIDNLKTF